MRKLISFLFVALLCVGLGATVTEKTASYGLLLSDDGDTIVMNSTSNLIVYLPALGTDNIGYTVTIMKKGTGQVKIQAPLADYVGDSSVHGYLQNTTASTDASVTLHLGKLHYWYITGATGVWATDNTSSPYGVESPTYGTVYATTLDTNVAAAGVTLAGTTLAADGTDSAINIAITPKGTGEVDITKVDIDSGAIDGTTIGANAAAAITGTKITGTTVTTGWAGAAAATGNVATENALGTVHSTKLTLTDVDIAPAAAGAGVAFGNVKLYDFPVGHVYMIGTVVDLALTDTVAAGAEMAGNFATWTPAGNWAYASDKWSHTTGDATALTTDVVPVAGTTYTVTVTMATSTAGGGLVIAMGGVTQSEVHGSATETWTFTASDATALTLTPASGTWVGDVTAVTVNTVSPVSATWDGDISFGTAADADGSLAGTEVDLVPKTDTPQAVAAVTTGDCQSTATEIAILDGHSTALDLYLNLLIDADDFIDAGTGALHLNGTVTVTWINLGDN